MRTTFMSLRLRFETFFFSPFLSLSPTLWTHTHTVNRSLVRRNQIILSPFRIRSLAHDFNSNKPLLYDLYRNTDSTCAVYTRIFCGLRKFLENKSQKMKWLLLIIPAAYVYFFVTVFFYFRPQLCVSSIIAMKHSTNKLIALHNVTNNDKIYDKKGCIMYCYNSFYFGQSLPMKSVHHMKYIKLTHSFTNKIIYDSGQNEWMREQRNENQA